MWARVCLHACANTIICGRQGKPFFMALRQKEKLIEEVKKMKYCCSHNLCNVFLCLPAVWLCSFYARFYSFLSVAVFLSLLHHLPRLLPSCHYVRVVQGKYQEVKPNVVEGHAWISVTLPDGQYRYSTWKIRRKLCHRFFLISVTMCQEVLGRLHEVVLR